MISLPKFREVLYQFCKKPYITRIYVDYDCTVSKDGDTLNAKRYTKTGHKGAERQGIKQKNPRCQNRQRGFCLVYRFYFKYLPTSTAGAEVSGAGSPEQSSVYPPTEIPVISPLPSSVSV